MKEGLLVFIVGLMTATMTLTIVTEIRDYKKSLIPRRICLYEWWSQRLWDVSTKL